jgi:multifunctional 2-oxoglutarate metabolism enzyme
VFTDPGVADRARVRRVVLCSGKVYYDLAEKRREQRREDVAVVRIERLYPLPAPEVAAAVASYPDATELIWVQEEPVNMGAWPYIAMHLPGALGRGLGVIALPESSAPAQGSAKAHAAEHAALVASAVG